MSSAQRTLPIRLEPLPGEPLDSWLEALAHRSMVDVREILVALGLHHRHRGAIPDHTLFLRPEEAEQAATASGVPVNRLHTMTLRQYDQHAVLLHIERRSVIRMQLWGRSGSRYCPECLIERDGRWLLRWRLPWTFACTRHRLLLAHECPACGHRPRHGRITLYRDVPPSQCSTPLQRSGPFCRTDLTRTPAVQVAEDNPVLAAQEWINGLLAKVENSETGQPEPELRDTFEGLRALAAWTLRRAASGDFHSYGEHIEQAAREHQGDGQFAPNSAAVAAGSLTRATELLRHPLSEHSVAVVRELLDRDDKAIELMPPVEVHKRWRRHSPDLQRMIWRAMDTKLSTVERLRYRSCSPHAGPPRGDAVIAERSRHIPQFLWRSWTVRLLPEAGRRSIRFRSALSVALLLPGWSLRRFDPLIKMLHDQEYPDVHYTLAKLTRSHPAALPVLCSLADYLDEGLCPIDYERRRTTVGTDLLPTETWLRICTDTDTPPGGEARALLMRRYLYQRVTGNHHRQAPGSLGIKTPAQEAMLASVPFALARRLLKALDEHALSYLHSKGIDGEPLVWEPPARLGQGLPLSQEFNEDLVSQAHRMICDEGARPALAAERLDVPLDYLRFLFETQPPLTPPPARSRTTTKRRESAPPRSRLAAAKSRRRSHDELTEEFLRRAYLSDRKSIKQISAETRLPRARVRERLEQTEVLALRHPHRVPLDEQWLREQYLHHRRSIATIAAELGLSATELGRRAKTFGIEMRPPTQRQGTAPAELAAVPSILRPALSTRTGWNRLHRFQQAVTYRTISEAATNLGFRQAVLSLQIRRLETDLGFQLHTRPHRGESLQVTADGQAVLDALTIVQSAGNDTLVRQKPSDTT
ncbi:TniQ family protein [Streptomyces sp. NPDC059080]|uniref:TniQ family protein n=1 Tax=Streptomyces sp. NPDC059080 TaxID=3346718 RepID=UPI0036B6F52C